jgi:hypothetical protein
MEPFHNRFPEIAEKETRCIIIPHGKKLPAGEYFLAESYCNDSNCDCRRVFINIIHNRSIVATIGYGWEDLSFYEKWLGEKNLAVDMKGPILELGGQQTEHSSELLRLFKEAILNDEMYIERLKRHYDMFKPYKKRKIGRNAPCLCGSGKKYIKCSLDNETKM